MARVVQLVAATVATDNEGNRVDIPPRAVLELEDETKAVDDPERKYRATVDLDATDADIIAIVAPLVKAPEAVMSDAERAELADHRKEFEATKTRHYTTPHGRGEAQVKCQTDMAHLVEKEHRAKTAAAVKAATKKRKG